MIRLLAIVAVIASLAALPGCSSMRLNLTGFMDGWNNNSNRSNLGPTLSYRGDADDNPSVR